MEYLASDELRGRGSGTEDEHQAAEYIGEQLKGLWHFAPQGTLAMYNVLSQCGVPSPHHPTSKS